MADDNDLRKRSYPDNRYTTSENTPSGDPYYVSDPRDRSYPHNTVDPAVEPAGRTYHQTPRTHVQERSDVYDTYAEEYGTVGNARRNTPEEIAYRRGYTEAREHERRHRARLRDDERSNNIALGLLIGVLMTSVIGLIAAAFYVLNRDAEPITVQPSPAQPSPAQLQNNTNQPQTTERTVIDRRQEVVPVPGEIEINAPSPEPQTTQPGTAPANSSTQPTQTESGATQTENQTGSEAPNLQEGQAQEGQDQEGQNQTGAGSEGTNQNSIQDDSTPNNSSQNNSVQDSNSTQSGSTDGNSFVIDR